MIKAVKTFKIRTSFREAAKNPQSVSKFGVLLIEEGLGNLRDCFFYTKESLKDAASSGLFEAKKCFADHPSETEEMTRPERSTRDILGYYQNVRYEESADGRGRLVADLSLLAGPTFSWAQALMANSVEFAQKYPDKDFVGLSINASGQANEVAIEDFMRLPGIPKSIMPKLLEAQAQGVSIIRPVNKLKDAVSCDFVTEAGAGGKILQMIEGAKMAKQAEKKEAKQSEKKESEKKENEAHQNEAGDPTQGDQTGDAAPDHADADQDKALFAQMIKQYLGDDMGDNEEAMEYGKHAYDAHKEMGMEHEAAYEAAGKHLKMAMDVGKKMNQAKEGMENESESESEAHESGDPDTTTAPDKNSGGKSALPSNVKVPSTPSPKEHKESNSKLISALGEIAKLKESLRKYEMDKYLDDKLSKSGVEMSITKKFREALGLPKSKDHVDSAYKLFMTGVETSSNAVGTETADFSSFFYTEKTFHESAKGAEGSLADCLE